MSEAEVESYLCTVYLALLCSVCTPCCAWLSVSLLEAAGLVSVRVSVFQPFFSTSDSPENHS